MGGWHLFGANGTRGVLVLFSLLFIAMEQRLLDGDCCGDAQSVD